MIRNCQTKKKLVSLVRTLVVMLSVSMLLTCASAPQDSAYSGASWNAGLQAGRDRLPDLAPSAVQAILIQSDQTASWAMKPVAKAAVSDNAELTIDPGQSFQTMSGYGGAFNEKGWEALAALAPASRQAAMEALFSPITGLGFSDCRIPIGASDYALSRYSLDDSVDDWQLERFSIERDRQALIPYIKAAQAIQPNLRFWASYWSPPAWLKTNGNSDSGALRDEDRVYRTLANYDLKFLQAYAAEGIPVSRIAVQNEPSVLTAYPSCAWTPEQFRIFIGGYLGPLLAAQAPATRIMLGTFNGPDCGNWIRAVMTDPRAAPYVGVIGLQWDGNQGLPGVAGLIKGLPLMQTETDCGNWHWKPGFNAYYPPNDFRYGAYTWEKIRSYLESGAEVYELWNMVLNENGQSIDSQMPWPQNSAMVIDTTIPGGKVHLTPMFHAIGHFSRYAPAGSVRLACRGNGALGVAFRRPDGSLAIQLMNDSADQRQITIRIGSQAYRVSLAAASFGTLLVPAS